MLRFSVIRSSACDGRHPPRPASRRIARTHGGCAPLAAAADDSRGQAPGEGRHPARPLRRAVAHRHVRPEARRARRHSRRVRHHPDRAARRFACANTCRMLARRLDKLAVVRIGHAQVQLAQPVRRDDRLRRRPRPDRLLRQADEPPERAERVSVLRRRSRPDLPGYVMLPAFPGYSQGLRRAGPYGGYLGPKFDPVFSTADAHASGSHRDGQGLLQPAHHAAAANRACRSSTADSRSTR